MLYFALPFSLTNRIMFKSPLFSRRKKWKQKRRGRGGGIEFPQKSPFVRYLSPSGRRSGFSF
jgi:hypothetical protein